MSLTLRDRPVLALVLSIIAAISALQAGGIAPSLVSADNTIMIQLLRAPSASESMSANGRMEIHLQTGETDLELHQATPNTTYTLLFISGSASGQVVGTLTTNDSGGGQLQATLGAGAYVGFYELTKAGIVAFASATTSIAIGATASTSTSQTQTIISPSNPGQAQIDIQPTLATINAGAFARFRIHVKASGGANVLLSAKSVPPFSKAIFNREKGGDEPEFNSVLTVVTSASTPPGTYGMALVALINGQESDYQIALVVSGGSTVTQTTSSSSISVSLGMNLDLTLYTNAPQYNANDTVFVQGHVTDDVGNGVGDASVAVQIDAANGTELYSQHNFNTDLAGIFQLSLKLPSSATAGTYTIFASASKTGYVSATTHATFVVGASSTPSVIIKAVFAGDSSGNPSAVFTAGQTVYIWVTVQNIGATFQGVIWVQVRDPNGDPVSIQIRISQLATGDTITNGFGFTFLGRSSVGLYSVNALVSDKLISQGGTFLASATTEFALTG